MKYLFANISFVQTTKSNQPQVMNYLSNLIHNEQHLQIETIDLRDTCQFLMPDSQSEGVNNIHWNSVQFWNKKSLINA